MMADRDIEGLSGWGSYVRNHNDDDWHQRRDARGGEMSNPWELTTTEISDAKSESYVRFESDKAIERAAQRKLVEWLAKHKDEFGSTEDYAEIDIPRDDWRTLCKALGVEPFVRHSRGEEL